MSSQWEVKCGGSNPRFLESGSRKPSYWNEAVKARFVCPASTRPDSLTSFANVREILEEVLTERPDHREALMMMSQLSECLLDYNNALGFLTRAFDAGEPKSKKSLKPRPYFVRILTHGEIWASVQTCYVN